MFQPNPHDQQKSCYPLLVPGNSNKNSLQQLATVSNGSSSSGTACLVGSSSTAKSIGIHNNEKISNFAMDNMSGVSSSITRGGVGAVMPQSSCSLNPPPFFNQDATTVPRPIATFEKVPIKLREFTNVGGFPLGPSNMRNATTFMSTNTSTIPSAPPTMGNIIMSIPSQQQQQHEQPLNTHNYQQEQEHNTETGPKLHFCKKELKEQTRAELHSEPEFRVNDKTKHPPNTLFNVSIKDVLSITGYHLNDCEMFLRLDNGSQHGSPVGSCFFKPMNPNSVMSDNSNRAFRAKIDIPPSLNTKKGNTSSRVGFVEIFDSNNKMIAVSDKFWIRSRSRNQMVKDESTKKRIRMNQKGESQKQKVFHDYSPTSPQQSENNSNQDANQKQEEDDTVENIVIPPPSKKMIITSQQYANPLSGAPSTALGGAPGASSSSGSVATGLGFNYDQRKQTVMAGQPMTSFSTATSSLLQQQQQVANDFSSLGNITDFWNNAARNTTPDFPQHSSFSFLDREMSNASNSRAPSTSNLLTPSSSWNLSNSQASEPLKTLENLVRNQQQRIEELSCLIANNAKLIHTLQMHVLSLTNPINSEP